MALNILANNGNSAFLRCGSSFVSRNARAASRRARSATNFGAGRDILFGILGRDRYRCHGPVGRRDFCRFGFHQTERRICEMKA